MKIKLAITLFILTCKLYGQSNQKPTLYFDDQIVLDSSSTLIIPVLYDVSLFASNKFAFGEDYYANIVFYNFKTDSSKKLFSDNVYITGFNAGNYSSVGTKAKAKNLNARFILYKVKHIDRNKSGRIDSKDPTILYVSDIHGNNLKALTTENENVVALTLYENQNFALIKIQKDLDNDNNFESEDKDFYFVKLDLTTLKFGNKIEMK